MHTPGPWILGCGTVVAKHDPLNVICTVRQQGGNFEWQANALLIARAPELDAENKRLRALVGELVEALKRGVEHTEMVETLGEREGRHYWLKQAEAAIAKVEGRGK